VDRRLLFLQKLYLDAAHISLALDMENPFSVDNLDKWQS
jgi:hypothetical protein